MAVLIVAVALVVAVVIVAVALAVAVVNVVVGVEAVEKLTTEMVEEWLNKKWYML